MKKKLVFLLLTLVFKGIGTLLFRRITGKFGGKFSKKSHPVSGLHPRDQENFARYQIHPLSPEDHRGKPIIESEKS